MSLNESIVEDAALEWFLLRQGYGGKVGELGYTLGHGAAFAQLRRAKPFLAPSETAAERESFSEVVLVGRLREAIRRLNFSIPEEARAAIKRYLKTRFERRVNP